MMLRAALASRTDFSSESAGEGFYPRFYNKSPEVLKVWSGACLFRCTVLAPALVVGLNFWVQ